MLKQHNELFKGLLVVSDLCCVSLAWWFAYFIRFQSGFFLDLQPYLLRHYITAWLIVLALSVSAGQILRQVKADGAPKRLPSAKDFDESVHGLGTVYEAAWMVFRMLGEQHGDPAVRAFYADVVGGRTVDDAAQRWFATSVSGITADWRRYLTKSASTVS